MEEYIKLLELPEEFDLSDLKKAYRQKVLKYHPDKAANEAERIGYEALMKKLNEANEYLKEYLESHNGKYSKEEENNSYDNSDDNYSEDSVYTDEDVSEEESYQDEEEFTQNSSDEYEETAETPKEDSISKVRLWISNNPKKFALFSIVYILLLLFVIKLCTLDSEYTPPENVQTSQQADTVQDKQTEETNKPKVPTLDDTQDKELMNNYMSNLYRRVKMNWDLPSGITEEHIRLKVSFKLDKYGKLVGTPEIKQSSDNERIDKSCIEAIRLTAPFGTIPINIKQDTVDIEMLFEADKNH